MILAIISLGFACTLAENSLFNPQMTIDDCRQAGRCLDEIDKKTSLYNAQKFGFVQRGNGNGIGKINMERLCGERPDKGFLVKTILGNDDEVVGYIAPGFYGKFYHVHFCLLSDLMDESIFQKCLCYALRCIPNEGVPEKEDYFLLSVSVADQNMNILMRQFGFSGEQKMNDNGSTYKDETSLQFIEDQFKGDEANKLKEGVATERMIYTQKLELLRQTLEIFA